MNSFPTRVEPLCVPAGTFRQRARLRLGLLVSLCLLLVCGAQLAPDAHAQPQGEDAPPPAVVVRAVQIRDVSEPVTFVGRVAAEEAVDLVARVDGFIERVAFEEGERVEAGQLLFTIEPDQYLAAVQLAEANVASAAATLREAEINLRRQQTLLDREVVSEATLDDAIARRDNAAAALKAAEAELTQAELELSYTNINSPIAGRIGARTVSPGAYVTLSDGALARVVQLDPIRVIYSVPETDVVEIKVRRSGLDQEALNQEFVPRIILPGDIDYGEEGRVDFVGNEIDTATGTLAVRAIFPNPDGLLLPGQFVTVEVRRADPALRTLVPIAAVQQDREGQFVYVVGEDDVARRRSITTGERLNTEWVVLDGLEEGELVVFEGVQKVAAGKAVNPTREVAQEG